MRDVKSLTCVLEEMGNSFSGDSNDLLVLDSRHIVDLAIDAVRLIERLGQVQYSNFVKERFFNQTKPIADPIKWNNLPLFGRPAVQTTSRGKQQVSLKSDCSLFSRLCIASNIRDEDMDEFFKYENQAYPPALSQNGKIQTGLKSNLLWCTGRAGP